MNNERKKGSPPKYRLNVEAAKKARPLQRDLGLDVKVGVLPADCRGDLKAYRVPDQQLSERVIDGTWRVLDGVKRFARTGTVSTPKIVIANKVNVRPRRRTIKPASS